MEPNLRDTPLRRFATFWWALGLFVVFGIAGAFFGIFTNPESNDIDTARGKDRVIKRIQNNEAQQSEMKKDPESLIATGSEFLNLKVEDSGNPHNKEFK